MREQALFLVHTLSASVHKKECMCVHTRERGGGGVIERETETYKGGTEREREEAVDNWLWLVPLHPQQRAAVSERGAVRGILALSRGIRELCKSLRLSTLTAIKSTFYSG